MPKKRTPEEETINVARSILYIGSPSIISGSLNTLELSGWAVTFASKIDDAPSILSQTRPAAALVGFDERDLLISGYKIETIIAKYQHVRWIALLPPNALEETSIRKLVGSVFYDYHTQPIQSERLLVVLGHAAGMADIAEEALYIAPHEEGAGKEVEMVGASEAMQRVYQDIRKVASTDAPVLITGESGTGKELAAQAIHERSNRKNGPFIAVNCGALPANLIQSELFGHEKGSFTGAHERKIGRIESATGGTLFLDEIGDLPLELQVNLLRFLQEQKIQRIGGHEDIKVNVRVLAATHVNLEKAISLGSFRQDLYYRLNVLQIRMPPLREREGDIPLLAQYVFQRFADERGHRVKGFSEDALQIMCNYDWPGNIRELINRVRRAMVMCDKFLITAADLGLERRRNSRLRLTLAQARDAAERDAIRAALADNLGSVTRAAEQLQISRVSLYRLMEKHGIAMPTAKS